MLKICIAVHLPVDLLDKINDEKAKTGQSQSGLLIDLIEKGLGFSSNGKFENEMFFFVKVRIDAGKMIEFGQKLQNGEIDTSHTIMTYCAKDDPAVGMSFWHADSQKSFEEIIEQHRVYYKEVMEVIPMVTPVNAMKLIMDKMKEEK